MRCKNGKNKDESYEELRCRICRKKKENKESGNVQDPKCIIPSRTSMILGIT